MTRNVIWQAALAVGGIALVFLVLLQLVDRTPQAEAPQAGGGYVEGIVGAVQVVNPILAPRMVQANPVDQDLVALVFEGLTVLDATGQISPALAVDWTVSEDAMQYEFELRKGVTWHDGVTLTAEDVLFTFQAIQDPGYQGDPALQALWRNVAVAKTGTWTVVFTLSEPFPSFLYYTTVGLLPAHLLSTVPAEELPLHPFSTAQPVGTGMFRVQGIAPDRVVLEANDRYWGRKPFLERLEFWLFGDEDGLLASYARGEVNGFHPSRSRSLDDLLRFPDLQVYSAAVAGYGAVLLNQDRPERPFFQVKEVRQALLYGLDRQGLVDGALNGQGLVADSPMMPALWAYDASVRRYGYDPERAMGLLDEAGWADTNADRVRDRDGFPLAFELLCSEDRAMRGLAEEIVREWRALGVVANVRWLPAEALRSAVHGRRFDAVLTDVAVPADPDPYPFWHSTQAAGPGQNYSGYRSEEADLAIEEARATVDAERRAALYGTFQQVFAEEVPALLLYYPVYTYAVDGAVKQVQLSPLLHDSDRFRNIAEWYVGTARAGFSEGEPFDSP